MRDTKYVNCGLCGVNSPRLVHVIRGYRIVQCQKCHGVYTNPRPGWDYHALFDVATTALTDYTRYYLPARRASYQKVWEKVARYRNNGSLLDVGCGWGFFLEEARTRGWKVKGVEPSPSQSAWARHSLGLEVVNDLMDKTLKPGNYDVLTLWDVVEHIPEIHSFLKRCRELLRPGGMLFIRTPNAEGLLLAEPAWLLPFLFVYRQLVYPANPLEHCYHFTSTVLSQIVEKNGFHIIEKDLTNKSEEWVVVGRNRLAFLIRRMLISIAQYLQLPYEFTLFAES